MFQQRKRHAFPASEGALPGSRPSNPQRAPDAQELPPVGFAREVRTPAHKEQPALPRIARHVARARHCSSKPQAVELVGREPEAVLGVDMPACPPQSVSSASEGVTSGKCHAFMSCRQQLVHRLK